MAEWKVSPRRIIQIAFSALSNGYVAGFLGKGMYKGAGKRFCLPGLNCYSCPGALGSCPIGALQAVLGSWKYKMSFYVVGVLIFIGALVGRLACGFLCPFGLLQDLLHKIPLPWKRKNLPGHRWLIWLKYVVLAVFVVLLPLAAVDMVGQGQPWFCKWICPSGTISGWMQVSLSPQLRSQIGFLFSWKSAVCIAILVLSVFINRPFCKYVCPLGAAYGMVQKWALFRIRCDESACVHCGKCKNVCPMGVDPSVNSGSAECIQCRECIRACPTKALRQGLSEAKPKEAEAK
ncbi:MAG: 4Fe-4S binding protein [Eubacteriales bacterium]|nr:4Fe-4S binding protein [Eubacteriales bacterium]